MISIYSGTPGTGKSLHVVDDIKRALKLGKNVISNFEFRDDLIPHKGDFIYMPNSDFKYPDFFYKYGLEHNLDKNGVTKMGNTLLVIDECQCLFDARGWNVPGRSQWNDFFSHHRKYGYNVILITQNRKSLDKRIQANAEYDVEHRNIKHYKTFGFFLSLLCGGNLFVAVTRYLSRREVVASKWFVGTKKKFRYYNSFKIFHDDGVKKK